MQNYTDIEKMKVHCTIKWFTLYMFTAPLQNEINVQLIVK